MSHGSIVKTRSVLIASLAVILSCVAVESVSAAALKPGQAATISWTPSGQISSIGPLYRLDSARMTPRKAQRLLGRASIQRSRWNGTCHLRWKRFGLRLTFTSFGVTKRGRCAEMLQTANIVPGSTVSWSTQNGLYLGAPTSQIDSLFPDWYISEYLPANRPVLVDHMYGYGDGPTPTLTAVTDETTSTVVGFNMFVGQAGD